MSDLNIRKLCIPKLTYSKYCAKCEYCIKALWTVKEGVKYGIIDVDCCATGGQFAEPDVITCPHGVAYKIPLGAEQEFDPADWGPERFEVWEKEEEQIKLDLEEDKFREEDEFIDRTTRRKKKGRRTNKNTFHGKSRGKYKQKEF